MSKEKNPLLSDEFIDEMVKEINQLYGDPSEEQNNEESINESD
ncbi:bacitracin ABC transporter ATP-binding protein [Neobacillus sp. FSL H8-0543]